MVKDMNIWEFMAIPPPGRHRRSLMYVIYVKKPNLRFLYSHTCEKKPDTLLWYPWSLLPQLWYSWTWFTGSGYRVGTIWPCRKNVFDSSWLPYIFVKNWKHCNHIHEHFYLNRKSHGLWERVLGSRTGTI